MTQILCRGLLLDMDGVLVDSTPAVARVWTRWAAKHHMDPDYVVAFAHGRTSLSSVQELLPHADAAAHCEEDAWLERAEIEDVADVIALPGAKELLLALASAPLAVVTSATRPLAEVRLRAAGLWECTRHLVTAQDIRHGKPDPEPYLKGAAALQLSPSDCVVVEDAPSGMRSAKAAGARVIGLRTTTSDPLLIAAGADWVVDDCSCFRVVAASSAGRINLELLDPQSPRRVPRMS